MAEGKIVWSDSEGDLRKKKTSKGEDAHVDESQVILLIRRLTSGKGRTVVEITGLPSHKKWCQKLCKELKKKLGVGGAYKNDFIEIHGEKIDQVKGVLLESGIAFKQIGG